MTDDSDSADGSTPGGGPTRVVSETNVDDILESIDSSPEPDRDDPSDETERDEENRAEIAQTEAKKPDERADSSERTLESDDEGAFDANLIDDSKPTTTTIETGQSANHNAVVADTDSSVPSPDETAPAETDEGDPAREDDEAELSARIERGAVTGADVRAAEAGEGREETSDIGDIDLSMDDLESSSGRSGSSGSKRGRSSTDGPLSGAIGPSDPESDDGGLREDETVPDDDDTDESKAESSSSGVFGRLKGLFSR